MDLVEARGARVEHLLGEVVFALGAQDGQGIPGQAGVGRGGEGDTAEHARARRRVAEGKGPLRDDVVDGPGQAGEGGVALGRGEGEVVKELLPRGVRTATAGAALLLVLLGMPWLGWWCWGCLRGEEQPVVVVCNHQGQYEADRLPYSSSSIMPPPRDLLFLDHDAGRSLASCAYHVIAPRLFTWTSVVVIFLFLGDKSHHRQ